MSWLRRARRAPGPPDRGRPKFFQYWDGDQPPPDVLGWVEGFRADNPELDHVLFSARTAAEFIATRYGPREVAAFDACAVPAMQSDLIRLFALLTHGGLYLDVDHQSRQPLSGLIAQAPHSLIFNWLGLLNNALLIFPEPGDPFLEACLALALENVWARRYDSAFMATGPGVFNAVRAVIDPASLDEITAALNDPSGQRWCFDDLLRRARELIPVTAELTHAYGRLTQMNPIAATIWIGLDQPAYKHTERHWTRWRGSIYRDG